jgi:AraC-like DNA-binding protein
VTSILSADPPPCRLRARLPVVIGVNDMHLYCVPPYCLDMFACLQIGPPADGAGHPPQSRDMQPMTRRRGDFVFRPIKIRHYVAFMEARGFSADAVLENSHIDPQQLKHPACLVDFAQYQTVVANMIRLTDNQGIGLEVGNESELTDLGIVGHAMMSSKTARDALDLWLRYSNALVGMLITMRLEEYADGSWSLTLSQIRPTGFLYNFAVEELLVLAVRMGEALARTPFLPSAVELSYPAPTHHAQYAAYLRCEPRFNCRQTRIRFAAPSLSVPLKGADEEFNAICLQHCHQIFRKITTDSPLVSRIHSLVLGRVQGIPGLNELADELGMSPRSLRRHLSMEGHTYTQLINDFRADLAKEYLGASGLTAKETSYLLGFKDTNAFRRAFKSWTGRTIHEFREEIESNSPSPDAAPKYLP